MMTMKELMQAIKKDVRIRSFVFMQMGHFLPRLVLRSGRLEVALYYYPVRQGDGPQVARPVRMQVLYDIQEKRPVLLEEFLDVSGEEIVHLWENAEEKREYMNRMSASVRSAEACLAAYQESGRVDRTLLEAAERDWKASLPDRIVRNL